MAAKNASQRRKVLTALAATKRKIRDLQRHWDVRSTIYVAEKDRPAGQLDYWNRDRRPEEYPEEQAASWAYAYNLADEMIKDLTELRETARRRFYEIRTAEAEARNG
jgi:hypothetical protein